MIPRRLRRTQPKPHRQVVIQSIKPLTHEQMRDIETRWAAARGQRPQVIWHVPGMTIKELP